MAFPPSQDCVLHSVIVSPRASVIYNYPHSFFVFHDTGIFGVQVSCFVECSLIWACGLFPRMIQVTHFCQANHRNDVSFLEHPIKRHDDSVTSFQKLGLLESLL